MSPAQRRLVEEIRRQGGDGDGAEYWPVVNDWVCDAGPVKSLALRNITRSVERLIATGMVILDEDGLLHLTDHPAVKVIR